MALQGARSVHDITTLSKDLRAQLAERVSAALLLPTGCVIPAPGPRRQASTGPPFHGVLGMPARAGLVVLRQGACHSAAVWTRPPDFSFLACLG